VSSGKGLAATLAKTGVKWGYTEADEDLLHNSDKATATLEPLVTKWARADGDAAAELAIDLTHKHAELVGNGKAAQFIRNFADLPSPVREWFPNFKAALAWANGDSNTVPKEVDASLTRLLMRLREEYLQAFIRWRAATKEWQEASLHDVRDRNLARWQQARAERGANPAAAAAGTDFYSSS